jgi:hypothetical protein
VGSSADKDKQSTFRVHAVTTEQNFLDLGAPGTSLGDQIVFTTQLLKGRIRGRTPGRFHALAMVAGSEPPRTDERSERDLKPPPPAERAPVHSIVHGGRAGLIASGLERAGERLSRWEPHRLGAIHVKHRHQPLAGTTTTTRNGTFLTRLPAVTPGPVADVLPPVEFAKSCSPRRRGLRMPDQPIHPAASQDTWPEPAP